MNLVLKSSETALAERSREYLAKECLKAVKLLTRLGLATMLVDTQIAELEELARRCKESPDGSRHAVDFTTALKTTQLRALILLYEAVQKERKKMKDLGLDDSAALAEMEAMRTFAERLGGQASLFDVPDDDDEPAEDAD